MCKQKCTNLKNILCNSKFTAYTDKKNTKLKLYQILVGMEY